MEEGFFAHEGITDIELITFPEDDHGELLDREAVQVELLARGVVDIGIDPRATFVLEARDQGKPVTIVAARRKNHAFVFVGQKGMKSIHDLRDKTLDVGNRGGAGDIMTRQVLKDHGLEPDRDVHFSYRGGPMHDPAGSRRAFLEGKLGPAKLMGAAEAEQLSLEGYPILVDLRKYYPSRHDRITAANESFVRDNPDIVKGVLKGMIRGCQFVLERRNGERFEEIVRGAGFLTEERELRSFESLFGSWQHRVSLNLSLPMEAIELIVEEEKKAGKISSSFKVDQALNLGALKQAQTELERGQ
jgi:ABC-type nitrate/sulfonate/bicarbonate transport system substrate-binding protein